VELSSSHNFFFFQLRSEVAAGFLTFFSKLSKLITFYIVLDNYTD